MWAALALLVLAVPLIAAGKSDDDEHRAQAYATLQKYLDARFRGARWKEVAPLVLWDEDQESACVGVIRSFNVSGVRLRNDQVALGTVIFYRLGEYCTDSGAFTSKPGLEKVLYQLRRKSIVWLVEKTNRPGANVDWNVVRERMKQRLAEPSLSVAETARLSAALETLEKTAAAIGRGTNDKR
jgi:hypothetical protein